MILHVSSIATEYVIDQPKKKNNYDKTRKAKHFRWNRLEWTQPHMRLLKVPGVKSRVLAVNAGILSPGYFKWVTGNLIKNPLKTSRMPVAGNMEVHG